MNVSRLGCLQAPFTANNAQIMRITVVDGPTALSLLKELLPLSVTKGVCINVAWVRPNDLIAVLLRCSSKIKCLNFGTSFRHTDVAVIDQLRKKNIRCNEIKLPGRSVFHPKEYYLSGKTWQAALVGSSNLTPGGLGGFQRAPSNQEASLFCFAGTFQPGMSKTMDLFKGGSMGPSIPAQDGSPFNPDLFRQGHDRALKFQAGGKKVDDQWVEAYKFKQSASLKARRQAQRRELRGFCKLTVGAEPGWLLRFNWAEFVRALEIFDEEVNEGLNLLDQTQMLLDAKDRLFTSLEVQDRKAIAGIVQQRSAFDPFNWHLFGCMRSHSRALTSVLEHPETEWGQAINEPSSDNRDGGGHETPRDEPIEPTQNLLARLMQPGIPLGHVTRLMAMVQPGSYLPQLAKNRMAMRSALGEAPSGSVQGYLEDTLRPLRATDWFLQKPMPDWHPEEKTMWNYRMALASLLMDDPGGMPDETSARL